jgi:hypothetical protein
MTEGMTAHAVQALVEMGYTSDEKAMDAAVARITRAFIFPKVKFTVDSDFSTRGKLFRVCSKNHIKGGGNKEHFKCHWTTNNGWKIASKVNHQQQEEQCAGQCSQAHQKV